MKIKDIMRCIRNVHYIMIHKNNTTKSMLIEELEECDYELEFNWFEITNFFGKKCIEFNL